MRATVLFIAILLISSADIASGTLVEQWTFDGATPETGVNGTTHDKWTTASPNSVPSAGILRYATPGNGTAANFATAVDTSTIDKFIMTIDVVDLRLGLDPANSSVRSDPVFQVFTDGGSLELELNNFNNNQFSPDLEQGTGSTNDLDIAAFLDWDDFTDGAGPLTMVATWDFGDQSMSLDYSGSFTGSATTASGGAANLANVTSITGFRVRGDDLGSGTFMDLDTVTFETVAIPEPSSFVLVSAVVGGLAYGRARRRR